MTLEQMLAWLRQNGWMVAVHNDYRQNGVLSTFWLFTHQESGRFVKGEGLTDDEAVGQVYIAAYGIYLEKS